MIHLAAFYTVRPFNGNKEIRLFLEIILYYFRKKRDFLNGVFFLFVIRWTSLHDNYASIILLRDVPGGLNFQSLGFPAFIRYLNWMFIFFYMPNLIKLIELSCNLPEHSVRGIVYVIVTDDFTEAYGKWIARAITQDFAWTLRGLYGHIRPN